MHYFTGERRGWRAAVWLAVAVAVAAAVVNGLASERLRASRARTADSERAVSSIADLRAHLVDAETGQRGYLLTGDDQYLDPYRAAQSKVSADQSAVQSLAAGRVLDPARVQRLLALSGEKMRELDTTIAMRRANRGADALSLVRSDRGKTLMDSVRVVARSLMDDEAARLVTRRADEDRAGEGVLIALVAGAMITVGVLLYLLRTLHEYDTVSRAAGREMQLQLVELEALMRARVAPPE